MEPPKDSPWRTTDAELHCGDCLAGLAALAPDSVDFVLCDLPYGQTENDWDRLIDLDLLWTQLERVAKPTATFVFHAQGMFTADLMHSRRPWWRYNLVWRKNKPRGFLNSKRQPVRYHEDIAVFFRRTGTYNPQMWDSGVRLPPMKRARFLSSNYNHVTAQATASAGETTMRYPGSVLDFAVPEKSTEPADHPTQKPLALTEWLIRTYSNEGDLVLDPCFGSGTTAVACLRTGRRFVGFEMNEPYWRAATARCQSVEREDRVRDHIRSFLRPTPGGDELPPPPKSQASDSVPL